MSSDLRNIAVSAIRENAVALRTVDKEDQQYVSLRDSVGRVGVMNAISVREKKDEDGNTYFEIVDGLHRYSAAVDNGLTTIPAQVVQADQMQVLERQIMANFAKVETKPAAFADALKRMLMLDPTLSKAELADRVSASPAWLDARLSLTKLDPELQKLVDDSSIKVSNAIALAKLPREEQLNYVEDAITKETAEFAEICNNRLKEIRDAARQGKDPNAKPEFTPVAHLRKPTEIKSERESKGSGKALCVQANAKSAEDGFYVALDWVLQLDHDSLVVAKAAFEARVAKQEETKKANQLARAEKREAEAKAKAEEARKAAAAS